MFDDVILIAVGIAALLGAEAVYFIVMYVGQARRSDLQRRLRSLADPNRTPEQSLLKERRLARSPGMEQFLRGLPLTDDLERLILQSGMEWTVAFVLGLGLALAVALSITAAVILRAGTLFSILAIPVGLAIPILIVLNSRTNRNRKLSTQLPDALDMMVRSLRAGHGLTAAFRLVAEEMAPPVAVEFGRCFEEQNVGVEFKDAIRNITERVPDNLDLKIFAVSVIIQRDTGGNLIEILEQIATTVRERFKFYGKLRGLTAEGKISAIILGGLPFGTALIVGMFNPTYLRPLVDDPLGRGFALVGFALWSSGLLWMRKMIEVDY